MNRLAHCAVCALSIALLGGCATVRHRPVGYVEAGQPLAIEVDLKLDEGQWASGTVHFLRSGEPDFTSKPLSFRGRLLSATIPTAGMQTGDSIRYYLDVVRGDELKPLGSAANPYRVRVLSQEQYMLRSVSHEVSHFDESHDVVFRVTDGELGVDSAEVSYQMPYLPGLVRVPMVRHGAGRYEARVPAESVQPGTWRYFFMVQVEGQLIRLPASGFAHFTVARARPPHAPARAAP